MKVLNYVMVCSAALSVNVLYAQEVSQSPTQPSSVILDPIIVKTPTAVSRPTTTPTLRNDGATNGAQAQTSVSAFDATIISVDKTDSTLYDAPATVLARSAAELERQNINAPRDLVRDEPGVSVGTNTNAGGRAGSTNYVIRGIGENRVRLEIDGYRIPDFPSPNAFSPTGYVRNFVDFDTLKRVEIIRGPASALYGSDAIGGVVSYITKDPSDYLNLVGKDWYGSVKLGYDTKDSSFYETLTGAARSGLWEAIVLYTHRDAHEIDINSDLKEPNPQKIVSDNVLGKLVHKSSETGELKLTIEHFESSVSTRVKTDETITPAGMFGPGSRVFFSTGDDATERNRISLDWSKNVNSLLADSIKTKAYATDVTREEVSTQLRASSAVAPSPTQRRVSNFEFEQTIIGGEIQATVLRNFFGAEHELIYGVSAERIETTRPRDRTQFSLTNPSASPTKFFVDSGLFPNKIFPDTTTEFYAAYLQDTIRMGALRLIPAVRVDHYRLTPKPDALFNNLASGLVVTKEDEISVSPKFGATYDLTENYRLFGQYARGFRAPPYDNANFAFTNIASGYQILPSGNLKPEISDGFEAGIRARFVDGSSFQLSAFYNQYEDFIDIVQIGSSPQFPAGIFQYRNLNNVTIFGFEGKGEWKFKPEWSLFGSVAYARGINDDTKRPIDSVDPLTLIGGVRYLGESGWGGELRARWVADKNQVSTSNIFKPEGYATLDALLSYQMAPTWTINAGIYNIFDESYFNPQDVAGLSSTNPNLELFRSPGRTFAINSTVRW